MADTPNTPNTPTDELTLVFRVAPERTRGKVGPLTFATLAQNANVPAVYVALATLSDSDRKAFAKYAGEENPGSKIITADESFVASKITGLSSHLVNACKSREMKVKARAVLVGDTAYGVRVKRDNS